MRVWKISPISLSEILPLQKDLINELKKHTAPEIEYGDKAALAQAQKIDALGRWMPI